MIIFDAFWFFAAAGLANMVPVFAARLPVLKHWKSPMDGGASWRGHRIFGANKTWRGLFSGMIVAAAIASVQEILIGTPRTVAFMALAGCLLGAGALLGDAIESFFKRQRGIAPGASWFPFDQTDYIVGGLLLSYPLLRPSLTLILTTLVLYTSLHVLTSYVGFLLKLKDRPI